MSQNLEKLFKESLQNMDAPYNPQAWDALQARLDAAMPVATPKKPFNPWRASAVVIGVVGISTALYFLTSNPSKGEVTDNTSTLANTETALKAEKERKNSQPISKANQVQNTSESKSGTTATLLRKENKTEIASVYQTKKTTEPIEIEEFKTTSSSLLPTNSNDPKIEESVVSISLPLVSNQCVNDEISLTNSNNRNIIVTFPSGKKQTILAKKQGLVKLNESGTYSIKDSYGEKENSFIVQTAAEPDFEIDVENIYKNGVPSTVVRTSSLVNEYKWTNNKSNAVLSGKEAEFHFFKSGNYTIQLEVTEQNGCTNKVSKSIHVQDDYNLMAVDAFNPMDNDPRRNTFMPFALKERNVGFTLTIIDPKDGGTVYQTKDASAGWDGIDRRTGNQASNGANYIWKVNIVNSLPGESDNYKGIVLVTK